MSDLIVRAMSGVRMAHGSYLVRLDSIARLTSEDAEAVRALPSSTTRTAKGRDILAVGERPAHVYVIERGWAARYSLRSDGSRRITGFMLPGDFCGIHAVTDEPMDHAITALIDCEVTRYRTSDVEAIVASSPRIAQAVWRAKLMDEAILRRWLLNSQDAFQAVAHLVCELHARASVTGSVEDKHFEMPLTQEHLGDALGLTSVHVNRMVKQLRESGLAVIHNRDVSIPDIAALQAACAFSPRYLHLPSKPKAAS